MSGQVMIVFDSGYVSVNTVVLSGDGRVAALCGREQRATLCWELAAVAPRSKHVDTGAEVFGALFEPETRRMVLGVSSVWQTGRSLADEYTMVALPPDFRQHWSAFSPDGSRLIVSGHGPYRADLRPPQRMMMFGYERRTATEWRQVWLWSCDVTACERKIGRFAADGSWLVAVEDPWYMRRLVNLIPTLVRYDAKTGQRFEEATSPHPIHELEVCGSHLVYRSGVELYRRGAWDVLDKFEPIRLDADETSVLAGDPHGRLFVSAFGSAVTVWDTKSWTVAKTYDWKSGPVTCLAVAPDGLTAAAGTATGKVVVWDVE